MQHTQPFSRAVPILVISMLASGILAVHNNVPLYASEPYRTRSAGVYIRPFTHTGACVKLCRSNISRGPGRPNHCMRNGFLTNVSSLHVVLDTLAYW